MRRRARPGARYSPIPAAVQSPVDLRVVALERHNTDEQFMLGSWGNGSTAHTLEPNYTVVHTSSSLEDTGHITEADGVITVAKPAPHEVQTHLSSLVTS